VRPTSLFQISEIMDFSDNQQKNPAINSTLQETFTKPHSISSIYQTTIILICACPIYY